MARDQHQPASSRRRRLGDGVLILAVYERDPAGVQPPVAFVAAGWLRVVPEECSPATSPTKDPMLLPVTRCQSPISTASANPVRVAIPCRQPRRCTTAVHSESPATAMI